MSCAAVSAQLGCDGAYGLDFDVESLRSETYVWWGSAWPFSRFKAHFYNGVLHATQTLTLSLDIRTGTPQGVQQDVRG